MLVSWYLAVAESKQHTTLFLPDVSRGLRHTRSGSRAGTDAQHGTSQPKEQTLVRLKHDCTLIPYNSLHLKLFPKFTKQGPKGNQNCFEIHPKPASETSREHPKPASEPSREPLGLKRCPVFPCPPEKVAKWNAEGGLKSTKK